MVQVIVLAGLVSLTLIGSPGYAQDANTLDANEFWMRLDQTQTLVGQALEQAGASRTEMLLRMDALWIDVHEVRLSNGQIIPVDVSWLRLGDQPSDHDLRAVRNRIAALLQFQRERYGGWTSESMLATLDQVLEDDRFQYGEEPAPAEEPEPSSDLSDESSGIHRVLSPSLAQIILMMIGVIAVVLFAFALLKMLNVQPAEINANGDGDDVPATSDAAHDRAAIAMSSGDYRAAIRYLYLASLLLLDERDVIRFSPSLTNTEHLCQITGQPQVRSLLEHIVGIFDRVWYGFAPVDDSLYQHFQHLIDQLQQVTLSS